MKKKITKKKKERIEIKLLQKNKCKQQRRIIFFLFIFLQIPNRFNKITTIFKFNISRYYLYDILFFNTQNGWKII